MNLKKYLFLVSLLVSFNLVPGSLTAFPLINQDPEVSEKFDRQSFDFVSNLFVSSRLAKKLACDLKARKTREIKKFSQGNRWVEILEIEYRPKGFFSSEVVFLKIPETARFGRIEQTHAEAGIIETFKIELGDFYGHSLLFSHDGKGFMTWIEVVSSFRQLPCFVPRF